MFILSCFLICFSSYILTSMLMKNSKNNLGFIYLILTIFSQIILSFEILSLFKAISANNFLICNNIFFAIIFILWRINKTELYKPNLKNEFRKILNALYLDKLLYIGIIFFIIFIAAEFISVYTVPMNFVDAMAYYYPRCTAWLYNGSFNHYITPDTRQLIMPVNMELMYTWLLMFFKSSKGLSIFAPVSLVYMLFVLYNFTGELGFSVRKRLWAICVFCSFPIIFLMGYLPSADLSVGALLLSGIYLFYLYVKNTENKTLLFFSALSMSLAMGTKTTAIIAMPSVFIICSIILFIFKKEYFKKNISLFILYLFITFMIFSSYNYILNLIHFSNPISCPEQLLLNKFRDGFGGYITTLIKYCFAFFDLSGINNAETYNKIIVNVQDSLLNLIGLNPLLNTTLAFNPRFSFNEIIRIDCSFLGFFGLLAFLPSLFLAIKNVIKKNVCNLTAKKKIMALLAFSYIFNILLFSRVMVFTAYNIRYLVAFVCISAPILVFSYIKSCKNVLKWLFIYFFFVYLFFYGHNRPVAFYMSYSDFAKEYKDLPKEDRYDAFMRSNVPEYRLFQYFIKQKPCKIGLLNFNDSSILFDLVRLRLHGFQVDELLVEDIQDYNLSEYDYLVAGIGVFTSSMIVNFDKPEKHLAANCIYFDYNTNLIERGSNVSPSVVVCSIPYNYLTKQGFHFVRDFQPGNYLIYTSRDFSFKG